MRLLVLGGTVFLSRTVAELAVAAGHEVTCACRGESGPLPGGVRHVHWDRGDDAPSDLGSQAFDAVVDVARQPSHVRRALDAVLPGSPQAHWTFVSTINVYVRTDVAGGPGDLEVHQPRHDDVDLTDDPEAYGPLKVACEQLVAERAASALLVRPGLIVGPGDLSARFGYWPQRLARGGEVLAPGAPESLVQVIDVRDLAQWIVDAATAGTTGTFDAVGEPQPMADLLTSVAQGVGAQPDLTWVGQDFLTEQGVEPWAGEDSLPLWVPRPEYDGMLAHDPAPALAAGLRLRPLADTASACLDQPAAGITAEREAELLARWHSLPG